MQSVNKNQIARLAALTLIFSYIELMFPRIIPFFRLGLGNTALLLGLSLNFPSYLLLSIIKAVTTNLMAGTLITPFFLISLVQNLLSALVMFTLYRMPALPHTNKKPFTFYGISIAGSAVSAAAQILLSALYLGSGTLSLLGPMLLFNTASGIITAWLAFYTGGESLPLARTSLLTTPSSGGHPRNTPLQICVLATAVVAVFFIKNTWILCIALCLSLTAQILCKRKVLITPHISMWLFVIISSVLIPNGKVLFTILDFKVTQGALLTGVQKALKLSAVSALSQCAINLKPAENTILGLTIEYYKTMSNTFRNTEGSVFTKLNAALSIQQNEQPQNQTEE